MGSPQSGMGFLPAIFAGQETWSVVHLFLVVFLTLLASFVAGRFLIRMEKRAEETKTLWDDALFFSLTSPTRWMIMLLGMSYAALILAGFAGWEIQDQIGLIRRIGIIALITWFMTGFISRAEKNFMDPDYCRKPMDQTTASALGRLLRIAVIITSVLVIMQALEYSISGLLAFGGVGGIAVGFAAKDLLANFFGGLMIYLDRPFSVGDWVRSPDKDIEGTVEDIGWRLTRIRTFDKRPLYVPNSTFAQISVENPSRMTNRRIKENIGIRYDDTYKLSEIVNDVKTMLESHEEIDQNTTLIVNLNSFAPSSLEFFVYCFTKTTEWVRYHEIKQDVMLKILAIIESHGAECAFPTTSLHVPERVTLQNEEN